MQVTNGFGVAGGSGGGMDRVGNGIGVLNGDQMVGRALVGISPILIRHPEGITGDPQISLLPQSMMIGTAEIDMSITDEQPLHIQGVDSYIIRRVVFAMASAKPDAAARLSIRTAQGQTGLVVLAGQALTALDPADRYTVIDVPIVLDKYHRAPVLFVKPNVVNGAALTVQAFVFGDAMRGLEY